VSDPEPDPPPTALEPGADPERPRLEEWLAPYLEDSTLWPMVLVAFAIFTTLGAALVVLVLDDRNPFALAAAAILIMATLNALIAMFRSRRIGPLGWLALAWWLASIATGLAALHWLPS
jgi:hypothetical protein